MANYNLNKLILKDKNNNQYTLDPSEFVNPELEQDVEDLQNRTVNNVQADSNGNYQVEVGSRVIRVPATGTISVSAATVASNIVDNYTDSRITSDMHCIHAIIGTPRYQYGNWTVTTSNGSVSVNGRCDQATTLVMYLAKI